MALLDELKKLITKVENDKAACEQSAKRSVGTFNASNQEGENMTQIIFQYYRVSVLF